MMATTSVPFRPSTDHSNISLPLSSTSSDRSKPTGLPWAPSSNTLPGQSPCTSPSSPPHPSGDRVPRSSKPRRYKSQYPLESEEQHVEYILVASFHIDRGPIMEHQYPAPISGDESMLAELMLPDQTHMRSQDWTIFFLHKDTNSEEDELSADGREGGRRTHGEGREGDGYEGDDSQDGATDGAESSDEDEGGQGPPLMYVLNLVNTKQDNTVKRGAVVKAMAICTRHSFLHIYKPLLLLALDDYFKNPYPETLAALYESLNNMDLSLMPKLSLFERHILQDSASKDMFIEKFERMIQQRLADEGISSELQSPPSPKRIAPQRYTLPRDTHEFESKVIYNDIPVPVKVPTVIWPETVGDFSLIRLIQTFSASPPYPFPLHAHLTTSGAFTHPIIVLINAMLTQKRVVFLGHNRPSAEVAETVLAACALASSGILRGFTRHAFPYTDLTKIDDLLKVPGFVAGVTNPAFGNHPEWWDLLCDLSTGKVKISTHIEPAPMTEGLVYFQQQESFFPAPSSNPHSDPTGDNLFMQEIQHSITNRHGENAIRAKWRSYITKFTRVAAAFEEAVFGATNLYAVEPGEEIAPDSLSGIQTDPNDPSTLSGHGYVWPNELSKRCELAASVSRIEGWRNTRSYYAFIQDIASMYSPARCIKTLDLHHHHDRLRTLKLSQADAGAILIAFSSAVKSYGDICQLLIVTPESNAGLFYISMGLFHPDRAVREATVDLLGRIAVHPAGQHFWAQLGRFAKLAYFRIKRDRDIALAQSTVSSTELSSGEQQSLVGVALGNNRRS